MKKYRNIETQKHNNNNNIYIIFYYLTLALLIIGFCVSSVSAGELSISAKVDREEITIEDSVLLSLTVSGIQSPPQPKLPDLPDFTVHPQGTVSQVQFINGNLEASTIFTFALIPRKAGDFTIGPATVTKKGKTAQSEPIQIKVVKVAGQTGKKPDVFVEHSVIPKNPYRNQQVVYTFRFYSSLRVVDARLVEPDFEGFIFDKMGDEREYKKSIGGKDYRVVEIRKALFPTRAGQITIGETKLTAEVVVPTRGRSRSSPFFSDFFDVGGQRKTRHVRAEPIEMGVREVPLAGRPQDFSGLVGDVSLVTKIEKDQLAVGDSSTLNITISGNANLRNVDLPRMAGIQNFKTYDDRPVYTQKISGNQIIGIKTFKRALVPIQPGEYRIPPVSISYFDPESGNYSVAKDKWVTLAVRPSEDQEELSVVKSAVAPGAEVRILGQDILPPHNRIKLLKNQSLNPGNFLIWAFLFLPFGGFLVSFIIYSRLEADRKDTAGVRRRKAYPKAHEELKHCRMYVEREDTELYRVLSRVIREYLGDWFDLSGASLTPAEAERLLCEKGKNPETAGRIREILEKLEGFQFGVAYPSQEEREELYREVKGMIRDLRKKLIKLGG